MPWRLRFPDDSRFTLTFGTTWLGRDEDCSIQLLDATVSRRHARLVTDEARLLVVDPGSRNGTWVDGVRVDGAHEIRRAAQLRLGQVELAVDRAPLDVVEEARAPQRLPPLPSTHLETPAHVAGRRQWYLEVQADVLRRALAREVFDEADTAMCCVADEPDLRTAVSADVFAQLLRSALALSVAQDSGRWIGWLFTQLAELAAPPLDVVRALDALPASLCVRALGDLDRLLEGWRAREAELPAEQRAALHRLATTSDEARGLVTRSHAATCERIQPVRAARP